MDGHAKSSLSVRIPTKAFEALENVNKGMEGPSVNRLAHRMLIESLTLAEASDLSLDAETPLLRGVRARRELQPSLVQLAEIDFRRTLTKAEARIVNIPTTVRHRDTISRLAEELGWSLTQVVTDGLHAFASLGAASSPLARLPRLLHHVRALNVYVAQRQELLVDSDEKPDERAKETLNETPKLTVAELDISQLNSRLFRSEANKALEHGGEAIRMEVLVDLL